MATNEMLRKAREERGLTQRQLAQHVGVGEQTISSWERGTRFPSVTSRTRLCTVLQKSPEELGFLPGKQEQKKQEAAPQPDINRHRMLMRVRARWITGVLEHSLHQTTRILLELQEQTEAVINPWHLAVQESTLPPYPLPIGTPIHHIYADASGELLILGEPGAGKTTLLLELTRDLLDRAEHDNQHPIPVVFNLSSWALKRQSISTWLVEELTTKYQVPEQLGTFWISTHQILPLLDGLDEVISTARSDCIKAINTYREAQGLVPIIICSRSNEYFFQTQRLLLRSAVIIQPLTPQQISMYLRHAGKKLAAVRKALDRDPALQKLMTTPLMLNIIMLAYQDTSAQDLQREGTQRAHVFATYIQRMLTRRTANPHYTPEQTIRWLSWLAQQLTRQNQTEFYIEQMQPDCLSSQAYRSYQSMILRLIYGIECSIAGGLFAWLQGGGKIGSLSGVGAGLLGALGSGPGNTVLGWMAPGIGGGIEGGGSIGMIFAIIFSLVTLLISTSSLPTFSFKAGWHGFVRGTRDGFISGIITAVFSILLFSFTDRTAHRVAAYGLGVGFAAGILIGLLSGFIAGLRYEETSSLPPSSKRRSLLNRLGDGLIIGGCNSVSFLVVESLLHLNLSLNQRVIYAIIVALITGAAYGFGGGTNLIQLGPEIHPAEIVEWSWERAFHDLARDIKKGILVGLFSMIAVAFSLGWASGIFYGIGYGLRYGMIVGLIIGVICGVAGIMAGALTRGWSSNTLPAQQRFHPNQGIRRSAWNGIRAAVLFGPIGGLTSGLVSGLAFWLLGRLPSWLILGTGFGIVFGIIFAIDFALIRGGIAYIQHYLLRWYLWRAGYIPWNYVRFLDYATDHILLQKVGGGYMFAHHLLLDYFASLNRISSQ